MIFVDAAGALSLTIVAGALILMLSSSLSQRGEKARVISVYDRDTLPIAVTWDPTPYRGPETRINVRGRMQA